MDFPLDEFFGAIAAQYEMLVEDGFFETGLLDKRHFQHIVVDALAMMCECGDCDDEVNTEVINWQIAMVSLFGNLDDVAISTCSDGVIHTYEARHKDGKSASVQCLRSEINSGEDHESHMIKAMEKLHTEMK